jgi:hypothetical protein
MRLNDGQLRTSGKAKTGAAPYWAHFLLVFEKTDIDRAVATACLGRKRPGVMTGTCVLKQHEPRRPGAERTKICVVRVAPKSDGESNAMA